MKKLLFFLFFLSLIQPCFGQQVEQPFLLEGTVKIPDGTPIPEAKIILTYIHHSAIRMQYLENIGPVTSTDEQGRFSLRFLPTDLKVDNAFPSRGYEWIRVKAEKPGFADLPYIEKEDSVNVQREDRYLQRPTIFQFVAAHSKEEEPGLRNLAKGKVYDDLGNLRPDVRVYLNASSERGGGMFLVENVTPGEYEAEYAPTLFNSDEAGNAILPTTSISISASLSEELGRSEPVVLSEENLNLEIDVVAPRMAEVLFPKVFDEQGNPISTSEYKLHLGTQGSLKYRHGLLFQNYSGIFPNSALLI